MNRKTWLELGRVSNLPTVWSNAVAGAVLSGAPPRALPTLLMALVGSCLYVGGMFLNDAFDAHIDARERSERPIPSGRVSRREVFAWGFGLLAAGLCAVTVYVTLGLAVSGWWLFCASAGTALLVIAYDAFHKGFPWSPVVMGLCRAGVYVMSALALAPHPEMRVFAAALALALYVVGLTHIARFETGSIVARVWPTVFLLAPGILALNELARGSALGVIGWAFLALYLAWTGRALRIALRGGAGSIPRSVVALIAGISLVDALFIGCRGEWAWAIVAVLAFVVTGRWQRRIRGT